MSDALPLPPRPSLEQYKKLARDFQSACRSDKPGAIQEWAARWAENLTRLQGIEITDETRVRVRYEAERMERRWRKLQKSDERAAQCTLSAAQFFIARGHGFASWPKFARHLQALARTQSPVSQFEAAADAIVAGDRATLENLLAANPDLAQARSTREHRSTLLHYVSANGVEGFRQKTPSDIVEIARLLLDAGSDVNAESDAYGGRSTTLGLTATSWHPENAGVQMPLMELLLSRGAIIDGPDEGVNACLHNGRGKAAQYLADHGAKLDLEGASGVGNLDVVKSFFTADGSLKPPATRKQMADGFAWACQFGHTPVVDFLLQHGMPIDSTAEHDRGETGLHWAAYCGHADTVRLLLDRGASVHIKDHVHDGTPLDWAIYGWGNAPEKPGLDRYYEVVSMLTRAGGTIEPQWYEDDLERVRAADKMRRDPRMLTALRPPA